jgi:peptide/nickel transport system substrate-binding protein
MRWLRYAGVLSFTIVFLITGCVGPSSPRSGQAGSSPQGGSGQLKKITAAILGNPDTLSQAINAAGTGSIRGVDELEKIMTAGLAKANADDQLVPQLAEAVPTLENGLWKVNPDGTMETTWTIKPHAAWQDGTPFTSADLLFTGQVVRDKDVAMLSSPAYDAIDTITAPDDYTVVVTWNEPFIQADRLFTYDIALPLPRHLLQDAYTNNKAGFLDLSYWTTDLVGAGPFKLREFVRDSHLIVDAWDGYILGRPKLDQIEVRFLSDPNVVIANILSGQVDMTIGRGLNLEQALQADQQWSNGKVESKPSNWVAAYPQLLTPDPAVIGDVRFRRALLQAIDRQSISDTLQAGRAPVAHSPLQPNDPSYKDVESSIVKYAYDPRVATQAIEQLGLARGSDGLYRGPDGNLLTVESRTNAGDDLKERMLLAISDAWKQAGVNVNTVITPRQLASNREYRATNPGFDLVRQPFEPLRFESTRAPVPGNNWVGENRSRYLNPELDTLIEQYYATIPRNARIDVLGKMVHVLSDQVVALGIIYPPEPLLFSNRLVNVGPGNAAEVDETWNVEQWDLRR